MRPVPRLSHSCAARESPRVADSPIRTGIVPVTLCMRSNWHESCTPRSALRKVCSSSMIMKRRSENKALISCSPRISIASVDSGVINKTPSGCCSSFCFLPLSVSPCHFVALMPLSASSPRSRSNWSLIKAF